ncbi:gas vesicle protein GvpK, partial [Streptomyces sp. NPDC000851]
ERIGLTLMLLDDRMTELRERYGLRPEDLNLDTARTVPRPARGSPPLP